MYILYKKKKGKNEKIKMVKWFKDLGYLYFVKKKEKYKYYYAEANNKKDLTKL
jgi:hypothetical protein